jgi:serine/threonine-protein kinase RsbW
MTVPKRVRLTIDSSLDHVSMVGNALRGILENEPGPRQDIPLIELAVCEAVNNAIIHGYGRKAGSPVDVSLGDGRLEVVVADLGQGFERFPDTLPAIPGGDDLEQMPMGGWGLRIMGEVMDAVDYSSAQGRNELSMSRRWE